jgi:hypothetical protein
LASAGAIAVGIILLLFGILLLASIIFAAIGVLFLIIAIILIIVGAVTGGPQVVVVPQPMPQPVYYPPPQYSGYPAYGQTNPSPQPVTVNVHQAAATPPPPQIMRRCVYCSSVFPESAMRCPKCGAAF